nr:MAG TPA: hypothetical protein [Caudoviricetes sp.]
MFLFVVLEGRYPVLYCPGNICISSLKTENFPGRRTPSALYGFFFGIFFLCFKEKSTSSFLVILYYILYSLYFRTTFRSGYLYESTSYSYI